MDTMFSFFITALPPAAISDLANSHPWRCELKPVNRGQAFVHIDAALPLSSAVSLGLPCRFLLRTVEATPPTRGVASLEEFHWLAELTAVFLNVFVFLRLVLASPHVVVASLDAVLASARVAVASPPLVLSALQAVAPSMCVAMVFRHVVASKVTRR